MAITFQSYSVSAWDTTITDSLEVRLGVPGNLIGFHIHNPNAQDIYIQFFNAAAAADVTLGTTRPLESYEIPANGSRRVDDCKTYFTTGIVTAATTTIRGTGAPTTALEGRFYFKSSAQDADLTIS